MESGHAAYRRSTTKSMTRVDMLIALYGKTLRTIALLADAVRDEAADDVSQLQLEANRCVMALLEGIDPQRGEVAENSQLLCYFALTRILDCTVESLNEAISVLQPMHEAFINIRDEAAELERNGQIPPLDFGAIWHEVAI